MNTTDPRYHTAPLHQHVKVVLHKGAPMEERVKRLRYKRRRTKTLLPEVEVGGVLLEEAVQPGVEEVAL